MEKQKDVGSPPIESSKKVDSGPAHADAATQTPVDVSKWQQLESILGFEPSEEPDQEELDAEITQGHWRCHLKRLVKIDRGAKSDLEFYRDCRPKSASWNGVALSRPFAPWDGSTYTSNQKGLHINAYSTAQDTCRSSGTDPNVESIYPLYRTIDLEFRRDTATAAKMDLEPTYHLEIKFPLIIELLQNVVLFHPTQDINDPQSDTDTKKHIQVLLDFLDSNGMDAAEFRSVDACHDLSAEIAYRNAWYLYRPGTWLLCRRSSLASSWMSIVESIRPASEGRAQISQGNMRVKYRFVRYNGSDFKWYTAFKSIKKEEWSGSLADAELVPFEYIDDHTELFACLRERGFRYWQLQGQHLKGLAGSETGESQEELDRVVIDETTYRRTQGLKSPDTQDLQRKYWALRGGTFFSEEDEPSSDEDIGEYLVTRKRSHANKDVPPKRRFTLSPPAMLIAPDSGELISPDQLNSIQQGHLYQFTAVQAEAKPEKIILMACQQEVNGFSLQQKVWKRYNVNDLGDVHFRKDAFKRLVLKESYKNILSPMVEHHAYQRGNQFKDLVEGKGQGLIILLHGPPGVGKTLAAECIADLYQRPLYSVTSGDIGIKPAEVETSIRKIFDYAVTWNAIVLLDQAEIFLAERDRENIERNALVSVFLRNLEYSDGILILTTNRFGAIDEAFQSRLDVALALEVLTINERKYVWYNFIEDLSPQISQRERELLRHEAENVWCYRALNGRQIRNCVKTTSILAKKYGDNISVKHVRITIKAVLNFTDYIQGLRKTDPERLAEKQGIRNHPSAQASHSAGSAGGSSRKAMAQAPRGHRSSSLGLEGEEDEDHGSDF